jgi:RHS repeat-associated protein
MTSIGRIALYATLVLGAFGSSGTFAQTTSQTRTSSFCYDMNIPGLSCTNSHNTGILNQEIVEPDAMQSGATDPTLWLKTDYEIDAYGNRTSVQVAGFDNVAQPATTITRLTTFVYDQNHQFVTEKHNALGRVEKWTYDPAFGKPLTYKDPNQLQNTLQTSWQYDSFGRKTRETRPDGTQTTWSYLDCRNFDCSAMPNAIYFIVQNSLDPNGTQNGPTVVAFYDNLDREVRHYIQGFTGAWIITETKYDGFGRVQQTSRPYFDGSAPQPQWTTYTYDALGRVTIESLPDGHTTQHGYRGLVTTDTNQNNQTRTVTKNSQGQVASVTDAQGNITRFYYDPFGNLLQTVDATTRNVAVNIYDQRGRKTQGNDPDLGIWKYRYDGLGQLRKQTDAKNQDTTLTYDALGRLTQRVEADMTATWTYDGSNGVPAAPTIGKLVSAIAGGSAAGGNDNFQRTLTYDSLSRPVQVATKVDGATVFLTGTYDGNGRLSTVQYHNAFTVKYNYTSLGYVEKLTDPTGVQAYWTANARDAELHLTQDTAGNGIITARGFDGPTGRLTSIGAGTSNLVASFSYTYDGVGNVRSRNDGNANVLEAFDYDSLNRLTSSALYLEGDPVSKFFSYDSVGNLLTKSDVGNYAYPEAGLPRPHGVLSIDGNAITATFSYDANGNQTSATGSNFNRTVTYRSYNKPLKIEQGANSISFYDDVDHQRFKQVAVTGTTTATTYYFDAFGVHAEVTSYSGGAWQWNKYLMVGGSMVGVRIERSDASPTFRYFHQDHLGSIAVITDETGAVVERNAYDPWGKRRVWSNGADDPTGSITSLTSRGFTGEEMLAGAGLGLVHLNGRVYDPYVGRMMSADPVVGDPLSGQSWNRYSYVWNNPLAYTDPTGYCPACIPTINPPPPSQNWFARHRLVGGILQIAITAVCVATPGCAPFAPVFAFVGSAAVAGLNGGNFVDAMHAGTLAFTQAMLMNGVGNLTGHTPAFATVPHFANVIGHALVGCLMASASGSTCGSGAAAGALPAFAGPLINDETFSVRSLVLNSTLGGLASVAGGGKFANGAVTGAFGYLFNGAMGRAIGGTIGGLAVGAAGVELGPLDVVAIALGRWAGGMIGSAIEDLLISESSGPPNPYGKKGGPEHQAEVDKAEADMRRRGLDTEREYRVPTPGGEKSHRCCDLVGKDPATQKVEDAVQVGKQTKAGQPVAREGRALNDFERFMGLRPRFVPWN